jgi:hypothetical protein
MANQTALVMKSELPYDHDHDDPFSVMRHKGIQIYKLPFVSALADFITSAVWFAITICSPDRLNVSSNDLTPLNFGLNF